MEMFPHPKVLFFNHSLYGSNILRVVASAPIAFPKRTALHVINKRLVELVYIL